MKQIYLIFGSDASWVMKQLEGLLSELIPPEMRDENLHDIFATSSRGLRLEQVLGELIGELATIPFLPDSRRVVVLHDLQDLYRASGGRRAPKGRGKKKGEEAKKKTPVESLAQFLEKDLPATENVLIVCNVVLFEKGQTVDDKSAFYKLFTGSNAKIFKPARKETDPIFLMGDALLRRDAPGCIRHFRRMYSEDNRIRIFREFLRIIRFTLQAKVLGKLSTSEYSREDIKSDLLPQDRDHNLYMRADFEQRKYGEAAARFQLRELMQACDRLYELNHWLIPSQKDSYVPDFSVLLESFIIEFCEGKMPARRA